MSRSYKKNLILTNSGTGWRRFAKFYSNRVVRRTEDIPSGGAYKKIMGSWYISDTGGSMWYPSYESWWPKWKARMK
jgi:hypothetical protein